MGRQTWIADRLRYYGLEVVEVDGWRTRGSESLSPHGVVCHHTAGAASGEMPSLRLLIVGRSDLPGPLCNVGLGRSGCCYVVAAGRANHAGAGTWKGLVGNSSVLGIEAESTGSADGRDWTDEQRRVYPILAAALKSGCARMMDFDLICGHLEWAPTRKIDPRGIDMPTLRDAARRFDPRPPAPPLPPISGDPDLAAIDNLPRIESNSPLYADPTYRHFVRTVQALMFVHQAWPADRRFEVEVDGQFGNGTKWCLAVWQNAAGLTARGEQGFVGPLTWRHLYGIPY